MDIFCKPKRSLFEDEVFHYRKVAICVFGKLGEQIEDVKSKFWSYYIRRDVPNEKAIPKKKKESGSSLV